jgi:hypothetical protein
LRLSAFALEKTHLADFYHFFSGDIVGTKNGRYFSGCK